MTHPGYRIFVLGAGFSIPAGLPSAAQLWRLVRERIEYLHGIETKFHRDVRAYLRYREHCDGVSLDPESLDLEDFLSYLDIEHFLGLRGGDTWSRHGNEAQVMVKEAIGHILHGRTPSSDQLPSVYTEFANSLRPNDIVITFNYDIILERALERAGKRYRLFPDRFQEIGRYSNTVDSSKKEVVVLKMHGSLDWFSNATYLELLQAFREQGNNGTPRDSIFADPGVYKPVCLVDGPRNANDPLLNLFRIQEIDRFYDQPRAPATPVILSPSHVKFVYASPLLEFWYGLGKAGGLNLGFSIIGFSLPRHDEYIRIALYQAMRNYQGVEWGSELLGRRKANIKMVDFRESDSEIEEYKSRYRFLDQSKTDYHFSGLDAQAIEFLFN